MEFAALIPFILKYGPEAVTLAMRYGPIIAEIVKAIAPIVAKHADELNAKIAEDLHAMPLEEKSNLVMQDMGFQGAVSESDVDYWFNQHRG